MPHIPVRHLAVGLAALLGVAVLSPTIPATAGPGDPVPSFDGDGLWDAGAVSNAPGITGLAVDAAGRIVTFGPSIGNPDVTASHLRRYDPDGTPDTNFSVDGLIDFNATAAANSFEWPRALDVDADGHLVTLTAMHTGTGGAYGFHVRRYEQTGLTTVVLRSAVSFTDPLLPNLPRDLTTDATSDRNILVAGASNSGSGMKVVRIHGRGASVGTVDTSFGTNGVATANPEGLTGDTHEVLVDSSGRILLGGTSYLSGTEGSWSGRWALARFTAGGVLDPTFGGDGMVTVEAPTGFGAILGLALDGRGRILAAGISQPCARAPLPPDPDTCTPAQRPRLARFKANGALDTTFGNDGWAVLPAPLGGQNGRFETVAVDDRGWILAGGTTDLSTTVARISPQGRPDPTFADGGAFVYDPRPGAPDDAAHGGVNELALDGTTVVAAGFFREFAGYGWAMQRLDDRGTPPTPRGTIKKPRAKPTLLQGTAGPRGQVARVDVALQKVDPTLLRTRHQCRWAVGTKPRFATAPAIRTSGRWTCVPPADRWRRAALTTGWKVTWTSALPKGQYVASARVTLRTGAVKVAATRSFGVG